MKAELIAEEAFSEAGILPRQKKTCELFLGRFQPAHSGHKKVIDSMHNAVIALVKGVGTSADKTKNPLSTEYQAELLKKIAPHAKIITVPTGSIPDIANRLRKEGMEVTTVMAGTDRVDGYKKMIDRTNAKLPDEKKFNIEVKETKRGEEDSSATVVRNAVRSGDEAAFRKHTPKELWGEFKTLQGLLKESDISFEDWLLLTA